MALPNSRNTTYVAGVSQVKATDLNDLQDYVVSLWKRMTSVITPAAFAAGTYNDVNIAGLDNASMVRLSTSGGAVTFTGLLAPSFDGKEVTFVNLGPASISIQSENVLSAAANRFNFAWPNAWTGSSSISLIVANGGCASVTLKYDATSQRWRVKSVVA